MKNIFKPGFPPLFGIAVIMMIILFSLSSCVSIIMALVFPQARPQFRDFGVFDRSVPKSQMSEIRFSFVNVTSFNGRTVSWGNRANNMGFVTVPAGSNTIVFDWVQATANMVRTDFDSVMGNMGYAYFVTTTGLRNITFSDVEMLPGHKYFIGGGLDRNGHLRTWLIDQTFMPSGFYGDNISRPPRASNRQTEFQGVWRNTYGETFSFNGNRWVQILPPQTGLNTSRQEIRLRGTFAFSDGTMTLYVTDTYTAGGKWLNIGAMRNTHIYRYSFSGGNLLLELPYVLPLTVYSR